MDKYITDGQKQYDALDERYGCKVKNVRRFFLDAHRMERKGRQIATKMCNNAGYDYEKHQELFREKFNKYLNEQFENVEKAASEFKLNWDARGYCIKIEAPDIPHTNIYMDWGRNGILCPFDIEINGRLYFNSDFE